MSKPIITQDQLKEILDYDPESGIFIWKIQLSRRIKIGDIAGNCCIKLQRREIGIKNATYREHRLAWLYMTGNFPKNVIDHIDGNRLNNRWNNLRDIPQTINVQNIHKPRKHNKCGVLGVRKQKNKWAAQITINNKFVYLGSFNSINEAHDAYLQAKRIHHPGCTI